MYIQAATGAFLMVFLSLSLYFIDKILQVENEIMYTFIDFKIAAIYIYLFI